MTHVVSVQGLLDSKWHFPLVYSLLSGKNQCPIPPANRKIGHLWPLRTSRWHLYPLILFDMKSFTKYFERTWTSISAATNSSRHSKWYHYVNNQLLLSRSSSIAKSWYHGFHSLMDCSNQTICKFLVCLKKEHNLTDDKISQHKTKHQAAPSVCPLGIQCFSKFRAHYS